MRGDTTIKTAIQSSLVLANGKISTGQQISGSVVLCDGDVEIGGQFTSALVIARGNITSRHGAVASVLMAGGTIVLEEQEKRFTDGDQYNLTKEKAVNPLGITFFELAALGLKVESADGAVRVSAIAVGKPFAKSGVRVGDVIATVNGKKPDSAESFRRLLRDALATGDATITLRRDERTETVKVSLPD